MQATKENHGSRSRATIVEVAERACVSIKTVSRVVNREPSVSDRTREKVEAAIAALDYRPNPSARGLAGNRSYSLGLLYQAPREFGYVRNALDGVMAACEAEGYALLMRPCQDIPKLDALDQFLAQTRIDGAVLTAPICDDRSVLKLLEDRGIPFCQLSPAPHHASKLSAEADDEKASYELTQYLLDLGHRRIGFIKGHPDHSASEARLVGYLAALKAAGLRRAPALLKQGYFDFESGKTCARKLLSQKLRPTAIFASNDEMASGVLFVARELGISVPDQLSVVGFDDSMVAERTWPPLTTVRQPVQAMADALTRKLIGQLRGRSLDGPPPPLRYACELILRGSAGPAPSE
ncbi:MAG: hypothetical protein RLZZ174_818 [Pseudomonadota bacterium]|jgi:LacI family transcriptional regulator